MRFNDDVYFAKTCDRRVLIKDVMITRSSYKEDNENNEDNEDVMSDGVISASYFCIKSITLSKYLTLYHVSYSES